jgi:alkanesulfonate monooxygenase SsuD/methylene tetrahydromethanopterin reductase-like flavin-dependent oxidoreductase (luciferase family)
MLKIEQLRMVPLSVLDLSPATTATPGSVALRNSLDLARLADRLGYKRYWVAERHNLTVMAQGPRWKTMSKTMASSPCFALPLLEKMTSSTCRLVVGGVGVH